MIIYPNEIPKRNHLCKNPQFELVEKHYDQTKDFKPEGFWYSIGDSWMSFAGMEEMFGSQLEVESVKFEPISYKLDGLYLYDVVIPPTMFAACDKKTNSEKILVLRSRNDIIAFTNKYKIKNSTFLDWERITSDYGGFEISDYHGSRTSCKSRFYDYDHDLRYKFPWYSTIDCSSGCIWNPNILKKIQMTKV
jgi:hypothetical protein